MSLIHKIDGSRNVKAITLTEPVHGSRGKSHGSRGHRHTPGIELGRSADEEAVRAGGPRGGPDRQPRTAVRPDLLPGRKADADGEGRTQASRHSRTASGGFARGAPPP